MGWHLHGLEWRWKRHHQHDELESNYQGAACLANDSLPGSMAFFRTADKNARAQFRTGLIQAIDPLTGNAVPWENIKEKYPKEVVFSQYADVTAVLEHESLVLSWATDIGVTGNCVLERSKADQPSELSAPGKDWTEYKLYVAGLKGSRYLFRGQTHPSRLRTSFHRTGRADLSRFLREDVPVLRKHLIVALGRDTFSASTCRRNLAHFSILYNTMGIRHHFWTGHILHMLQLSSRTVGFRMKKQPRQIRMQKSEFLCSIRNSGRRDWRQILFLVFPGLHFSIGEFMAIENERMIP